MGAARWLLFERCARELMELAYSVPILRRHIVVCPLGGGGGVHGFLKWVPGCVLQVGGRVAPWRDLSVTLSQTLARLPSLRCSLPVGPRSRAGDVLVVRAPHAVGRRMQLRSRVPRSGRVRSPSPAAGGGDCIGVLQACKGDTDLTR